MMRDFYNGDFEELIRQKADQYKMYPSEKVWKEINRSLHSRRKWYWSGLVLLLSGVSYFAIQQLITPSTRIAKNNQVDKSASANTKQAVILPFESYIPTAPAIGDKSGITTNKSSAPVINMFPVPTQESIQLNNGYNRNTR
ncbi:MAG TPA: hypothetical protein VM012_01240, partial [Flavitalea sp.]|nr:hypothetical protein [Flavitalea sp.]